MKKFILIALLLVPLYLPGCTKTSDDMKALRDKIAGLEQGQASILKEIQSIKDSLTGRAPSVPAFRETLFDIADDPFRGLKNAVVTLVDFSDYE